MYNKPFRDAHLNKVHVYFFLSVFWDVSDLIVFFIVVMMH